MPTTIYYTYMVASIGLKIANGDFYSILEENSTTKKRLVLTTVHDNQKSAQIDLYRSFAKTMADALYIGSLVIENISPKTKGEPSFELLISSNENGEITADAYDLEKSAAEHQYLSVSLKAFDDDIGKNIPDYELEEPIGLTSPPPGLFEDAAPQRKIPLAAIVLSALVLILLCFGLWWFLFPGRRGAVSSEPLIVGAQAGNKREDSGEGTSGQKKGGLGASGGLDSREDSGQGADGQTANGQEDNSREDAEHLVSGQEDNGQVSSQTNSNEGDSGNGTGNQAANGQTDNNQGDIVQTADSQISSSQEDSGNGVGNQAVNGQTGNNHGTSGVPPPILTTLDAAAAEAAPDRTTGREPPVASFKIPARIPPGGVPYRMRWGDTLWDVSKAFYRNGYLYTRIARFNKISNPNRVVSGTVIRVPPQ